jgi:ribosomal protein S18 acetylase RimI-like enzyme
MEIRLLTGQDGPDYQILRLRALQTNPDAFLSTYDSESNKHEISFSNELDYAYSPPYFGYYGCFEGERLIGFCLVTQSYLNKQDHVAFLYNLYVDPEFRKQKVGTQLVAHVINQLAQHEHIERLFLSCTAKNKIAVNFYKKTGFQRCGIRPRSVKWNGDYDDEIEMVKILA